jgi:hypothetical protein
VTRFAPLLLITAALRATALTPDEMKLLQDSGGWEYMSITDADNGFETHHVCFDPATPSTCKGNLLFRPDMTFTMSMQVHGQTVNRAGTYQVDGGDIVFVDEFNNKDGPYTAELNPETKTLVLGMVEAGVHLRMELLEAKEFRKRQEARKKSAAK